MEKEMPENIIVSIIIINWNNWKDTIHCLNSIFQIKYSDCHIILVDNSSDDDSVLQIKNFISSNTSWEMTELDHCGNYLEPNWIDFDVKNLNLKTDLDSKQIFLIKNHTNHGFAGGNNIGMNFALEYINPDYILLLNNDTTVDKHFLNEMLKVVYGKDSVGSVQAVLLNHNGRAIDSLGQECYWWGAEDICMGTSLDNAQRFMGESNDNMEIFGSCAAAALYPSEVLRKTGLFDEDFFVELEDVDLSWRIRLMGYKSYLARKSRVYHKRGVSGTITSGDLVRGLTNKSMINKWHHQSKNWLIIVGRYYPRLMVAKAVFRYPHKVIFTYFRLIYSSIWLGKTKQTFKILSKNSKKGKKIKKNQNWNEIVQKWIRKRPKC